MLLVGFGLMCFVDYFGMRMLSDVRGLCLLWLADRLPVILVGGTHVSTRSDPVWETKIQS
jgi:hypothetical protein